jgi:hypothetical protein
VDLFKQRSRALSSLQWMQAIPKKPHTLFLQFLSEFGANR